ncbi:MAG: peptidylprolyl isomerase [Myxococcales bacterium]|nr:peptidylprolyl isomerase [Myxococcales bacterium]
MTIRYTQVSLLISLITLVGCGGKASNPERTELAPSEQAQAPKDLPAPSASPDSETNQEAKEPGAELSQLDPKKATLKAPNRYTVKLETARGNILIDVTRAYAPRGADRFYNLVKQGYYDDTAFFRVIGGFMAQGGLHGNPQVNRVWRDARIEDDPVIQKNTRGMVSFATAGPGTRTTQFFINFADNSRLDSMGFSPFGKVRDMKTVDALYAGYGEGAPGGSGPDQSRIHSEGNAYLKRDFPKLDYITQASIVK